MKCFSFSLEDFRPLSQEMLVLKQRKTNHKLIFKSSFPSCCDCLAHICRRKKELKARTVWLGCPEKCEEKYPKNAIKNQKYNVFTFVPGVSHSSSLSPRPVHIFRSDLCSKWLWLSLSLSCFVFHTLSSV